MDRRSVNFIDVIVYGDPATCKYKRSTQWTYERDILWARASVVCGTQDVSHRESDSKEKGGRSCIAIRKVEKFST